MIKPGIFLLFFVYPLVFLQAQNWLHHPGGTPFSIHRLYADTVTDEVIAAGAFTMVGNVPAQGIAVWDDTVWTPAAMQTFTTSPNFYSVGKYNSDYVFGGTILDWNQTDPVYVVRWNGTSLDSIGHLRVLGVHTITQWGNDLVITTFIDTDTINGVPFNSIARWDGTNWYDLGGGVFDGPMLAVAVYRNDLYVTSTSLLDNEIYIYKRVANTWQIMGQPFDGPVFSMCVFNNELYAGGYFSGNGVGSAVLKLDTLTNTWVIPGGGIDQLQNGFAQVNAMAVMGGKLYVVGTFELAGGVPSEGVCAWDGTRWCSLGNATTYPPRTCAALDSSVFIVPNSLFDGVQATGFVEWVGGNYTDSCGFLTTSLPEPVAEETIQVAPNPATDHITFSLPEITTGYRVWILNSMGQTVLSTAGRESTLQVELGNYASGIYFYRLETDEGQLFRGRFFVRGAQ